MTGDVKHWMRRALTAERENLRLRRYIADNPPGQRSVQDSWALEELSEIKRRESDERVGRMGGGG